MKKRCLARGCTRLITYGSYCLEHVPYRDGWGLISAGVLRRDDYRCQIRGPHCTGTATTVDHINGNPRDNTPFNLQAACRACNTAKGGLA